ncbi:Wzz/FepE/Etk N-terminal domain-containing protein [Thioclava sp.]|uniref:Wzz/FepE/Etk N-terminal domain-containing protein n=1 Tax=Thioclava sp. TaxID=1933450 RepID=UPI003AA8E753
MNDPRARASEYATRQGVDQASADGEVLIDFRKLARAARRQRWVMLAWIAGFCVLGLAYLATTPSTYRAASTVLLSGQSSGQVENLAVTETVSDASVETAQQIFQSRDLALRVDDILKLHDNAAYLNAPTSLASRIMGTISGTIRAGVRLISPKRESSGTEADGSGDDPAANAARNQVARSLQSDLVVSRIGRSTALQIEIALHDPVLAARIVNAYTQAYISDQLNTSFEATTRTTEFLQQRLSELEADARKAAMAAEAYRAEAGLVATGDGLITEENLNRLNAELSLARGEAASSRALVASYDEALSRGAAALKSADQGRLSLPGDARLVQMGQALSALSERRAGVVRNFGPDHPQIAILDAQIDESAQRLYSEMARQAEIARGAQQVAEARVTSLRETLVPLVEENSKALRAQIEYRLLQQRTDTLMRLYETFLTQFQGAEQLRLYSSSQIRVLTAAEVPRDAAAPSAKRVLALVIVLGLLAGLVHAAIRETREHNLRTAAEVMDGLKLRFLGYLPPISLAQRKRAMTRREVAAPERQTASAPDAPPTGRRLIHYPLAHIVEPRSRYCETLRAIRHVSIASLASSSGRMIGVTSVLPYEGKTTLAADLAGILAVPQSRVLLVDGDPRSRRLSHMLGLGTENDLAKVLAGASDWRDCMASFADAAIDVIGWSDSVAASHPTDILASSAMRDFLLSATQDYTHVVVDLAPLSPVVDARDLFLVVDQILLTARWGSTPFDLISRSLQQEPEMASRLLGMVLGDVDMRQLKRYIGPGQAESFDDEFAAYFE